MLELARAFRRNFMPQTKFDGTLLNEIRICKNRKMHSWSFGKQKRQYNITDNDIDMKFGPDVINSAANSWKK